MTLVRLVTKCFKIRLHYRYIAVMQSNGLLALVVGPCTLQLAITEASRS